MRGSVAKKLRAGLRSGSKSLANFSMSGGQCTLDKTSLKARVKLAKKRWKSLNHVERGLWAAKMAPV